MSAMLMSCSLSCSQDVDHDKAVITHKNGRFGPFAEVYSDAECTNEVLFNSLGRRLVLAATQGYNGTLFTYGQTGSGKTYTMGESNKLATEHEGVGHRIVRDLFATAARDVAHTYEVELSFVQVYCERIYDLLHGKQRDNPLALREDKSTGVYVDGASKVAAKSVQEALALMRAGQSRLAFASTNMNKHSSRSHGVCMLHVKRGTNTTPRATTSTDEPSQQAASLAGAPDASRNPERSVLSSSSGIGNFSDWRHKSMKAIAHVMETASKPRKKHRVTRSMISLVDLAGSEDVGRSGASADTLAEAKKINTSLLALGNVIASLTREDGGGKGGSSSHIPYRDSVLTRLLQASIGGNCKTALICCASPADSDLTETLSTLRFAARAKMVRNHAHVNASEGELASTDLEVEKKMVMDAVQSQLDAAHATLRVTSARILQLVVRARQREEAHAADVRAKEAADAALATQHEALARLKDELEATQNEQQAQMRSMSAALEAAETKQARSLAERADEASAATRKLAASNARLREAQESYGAERAAHEAALSEMRAARLTEVSELRQQLAACQQEGADAEREAARSTEEMAAAHAARLTEAREGAKGLQATIEELRAENIQLQAEVAKANDEASVAREELSAARRDAEATRGTLAGQLSQAREELASLNQSLSAARGEAASAAEAAAKAATESTAREAAVAAELEEARRELDAATSEAASAGVALNVSKQWQNVARLTQVQNAEERIERARRAQAEATASAEAARRAATEAAAAEAATAIEAARQCAEAAQVTALEEQRRALLEAHERELSTLRAELEAKCAEAVEAASQAARQAAAVEARAEARADEQEAAERAAAAMAEAVTAAREHAASMAQTELESRLREAEALREAALASARAAAATERAAAARESRAEAEAEGAGLREQMERSHELALKAVRDEMEAHAAAASRAAKAEAELALAVAVRNARDEADRTAREQAQLDAQAAVERAACQCKAAVSTARVAAAREARAEAQVEYEEALKQAVKEAAEATEAAAEQAAIKAAADAVAEERRSASAHAASAAEASGAELASAVDAVRAEVEAAATAELSIAVRQAQEEADRELALARDTAQQALTAAREETAHELRAARAQHDSDLGAALAEMRSVFEAEREELETELRGLREATAQLRSEVDEGTSRETRLMAELEELREEAAQLREGAQRDAATSSATLSWTRASLQSKVRASGSAAAAREAALSAEVVELNRTVGRMSRQRLADLSYEARLRKQQRESRGPARAEAGCSPLRFDENAWSNGDLAPAARAQPCRTMHGYPTYEEAMEEYVTQMSAAERTELEYYRSLTYVSY